MPNFSTQEICPNCNGSVRVNFGQSIVDRRLRWYASYVCAQCDYAVEADGGDDFPDEFREIAYEQDGIWTAYMKSLGSSPAAALKAVRTVLDLTLDDMKSLQSQFPATIGRGTQIEMAYLKSRLLDEYDQIEIEVREGSTVD